jgi:hypothetical protein
MSVVPIESVRSSVVFGGTNQSICVYEDRVLIDTPRQQGPDTVEISYEQIGGIHLHTGVFYATLTLSTPGGYGWMVRWLPKRKALRVAELIRRRVRPA